MPRPFILENPPVKPSARTVVFLAPGVNERGYNPSENAEPGLASYVVQRAVLCISNPRLKKLKINHLGKCITDKLVY